MYRHHNPDSEVLELRSALGASLVVGIAIAGVGVFVLLEPLSSGRPLSLLPILIFGGFMLVLGLAIMFSRSTLVLDRRRGVIVSSWSILGYEWKSESSMADYRRVVLSYEVRQSGGGRNSSSSTKTVYPVRLEGGAASVLNITEMNEAPEARRLGEEVAKFLNVGLADRTSGVEILREPGTMDESVRDRFARKGIIPELQPPPPECRIQHRSMGSSQTLELPPVGLTCGTILMLVVGSFFLFIGIPFIFTILAIDELAFPLRIGAAVLPVLPGLGIIVSALLETQVTYRIDASPLRLVVERRGVVRTNRTEFPCQELEEVEIVGSKGAAPGASSATQSFAQFVLMARSDTQEVRFGAGLPTEQLEWIKNVIEVGLCS